MNSSRLLQQAFNLTLAVLLLAGCIGAPADPTATSTPVAPTAPSEYVPPIVTPIPATPTFIPFAKEGHWEGNPSVSFEVTDDGMVNNFMILIGGDCEVKVNVAYPIGADHVFLIGEVDSSGQPVDNGILGIFDSPTTITGSFANPWRCGTASAYTEIYLPSDLNTWNAEWKRP